MVLQSQKENDIVQSEENDIVQSQTGRVFEPLKPYSSTRLNRSIGFNDYCDRGGAAETRQEAAYQCSMQVWQDVDASRARDQHYKHTLVFQMTRPAWRFPQQARPPPNEEKAPPPKLGLSSSAGSYF